MYQMERSRRNILCHVSGHRQGFFEGHGWILRQQIRDHPVLVGFIKAACDGESPEHELKIIAEHDPDNVKKIFSMEGSNDPAEGRLFLKTLLHDITAFSDDKCVLQKKTQHDVQESGQQKINPYFRCVAGKICGVCRQKIDQP